MSHLKYDMILNLLVIVSELKNFASIFSYFFLFHLEFVLRLMLNEFKIQMYFDIKTSRLLNKTILKYLCYVNIGDKKF